MSLLRNLILCCLAFVSLEAKAVVDITINRGTVEATPIAIPAFFARTSDHDDIAHKMLDVIERDLAFSGFFAPLDQDIFLQTSKEMIENQRFNDWRIIQAQLVLVGDLKPKGHGRFDLEAFLYDPFSEKKLLDIKLRMDADDWRVTAHKVADKVYEYVTGERGYFNTKILYVADSGTAIEPVKRLAIMDQDGMNMRYLTDGKAITMSPHFSPDGKMATFLSYHSGHPKVYLMHLDSGRMKPLADARGMSFAPRFSPDNKKLIYSISKMGNSSLFEMDLKTRKERRLTSGYHIDTSPSYSPDGKKVVFESNRGGYQKLYVMDLDTLESKRISFGAGLYGTPVWSPKGNLIAFTRMFEGQFSIGVMRPNGDGMRIIVQDYHVEAPDWAPNGRRLIYFRETKPRKGQVNRESKLYTIDLTGYDEQQVPTLDNASDPAWSL